MNESAQLMGDRWASLIMRSIFTNLYRFDEIRQDTAIATNILSERLKWLELIGVIPYARHGGKILKNLPIFLSFWGRRGRL